MHREREAITELGKHAEALDTAHRQAEYLAQEVNAIANLIAEAEGDTNRIDRLALSLEDLSTELKAQWSVADDLHGELGDTSDASEHAALLAQCVRDMDRGLADHDDLRRMASDVENALALEVA